MSDNKPNEEFADATSEHRIRASKSYGQSYDIRKNIELGFEVDKSGNAIAPDHETLRHFEKGVMKEWIPS